MTNSQWIVVQWKLKETEQVFVFEIQLISVTFECNITNYIEMEIINNIIGIAPNK